MATMVNMTNLLNGKDSRWLQLEVCREFQRNKCTRVDTECKFAHPPANVEVQNGRVTACYDSIKGRCNREKPPCKYFHPPQHLKDQLLINGRNHLALKNALMQQMGITPGQAVLPGQCPVATNPYLTSMPANATYNPFYAPGHLVPTILGPDPNSVQTVVQQAVPVAQQKIPRSDRIETFHGMMPFKRPAADKSGIPVYQPGTTYQQLMQLQQPFVPVSCEYPTSSSSSTSSSSYSTSVNNSTTSATHTATTLIPQPHTTITSSTANPNAIINNNNNNSTTTTNNNNHIFVNQSSVNNNSSNNNVATTTASNGIVGETNNNNNNNNASTVNKEPNTSTTSNTVPSLNSIAAQIHNHVINSTANSSTSAEDDLDHSKKSKDAVTSVASVSLGNSASNAISFSSAVAPTSSVAFNSSLASFQQQQQQQQQQHASLAYNYPQASQNHFLHANQLYANPAAIAKEVAQKNYQNALKLAAVSNALTGKPLSALTYSQVPFNKPALLPQPAYAAAPQLTSPRPALAAPVSANRLPQATAVAANSQAASQFLRGQTQLSALSRAQTPQTTYLTNAGNPYAQFMRPQTATAATYNPAAAAAALSLSHTNPYAAQAAMQQAQVVAQMQAAAAANQQIMFYHNLQQQQAQQQQQQAQVAQYPGMTTAGLSNAQQTGLHPNALAQTAPPGTTAVVLNPYKKMKTS